MKMSLVNVDCVDSSQVEGYTYIEQIQYLRFHTCPVRVWQRESVRFHWHCSQRSYCWLIIQSRSEQ